MREVSHSTKISLVPCEQAPEDHKKSPHLFASLQQLPSRTAQSATNQKGWLSSYGTDSFYVLLYFVTSVYFLAHVAWLTVGLMKIKNAVFL